MAAAKKKTRKELLKDPDEFLTITARVLGAASRYQKEISYAVIGLLVIAALFSGYRFFTGRAEVRAAELLDTAVSKYDRLVKEQSREKAFQEVSADFVQLIDNYSSRSSGVMARLMFANMCYEAGDYTRAAELYKALVDAFAEHPAIRGQILVSLGHTYTRLKELPTALGYFERALPSAAPALQAEVLFHAAEIHRRMGNVEKSTETFKRLLADHGESLYAEMVRERVGG